MPVPKILHRVIFSHPPRVFQRKFHIDAPRAADENNNAADNNHDTSHHMPGMTQIQIADEHPNLESNFPAMRTDIEQLKSGIRRIEISNAVMGVQIAGLVADVKEVKRTSNYWLYALVTVYVLKESYDRYALYGKDVASTSPPSVNIYNDRFGGTPVMQVEKPESEKNAERSSPAPVNSG
ncbi:hypothetical protein HOY82DRAFT_572944 [Tuber indicum]|nr:hypothetical protein HOY82DRAFT_572944 [Tuber indicum]